MTTESKAREFILKKKEKQTIDADYNAIEARPESECDPRDIEDEKILKYIRVIEKSFADKLQAELKTKDELLREFIDIASDVVGMEMRMYGRLSNTSGLGSSISILNSFIEKLREGKK